MTVQTFKIPILDQHFCVNCGEELFAGHISGHVGHQCLATNWALHERLGELEKRLSGQPFTRADVEEVRSACANYMALEALPSGKPSAAALRLLSLADRIEARLSSEGDL